MQTISLFCRGYQCTVLVIPRCGECCNANYQLVLQRISVHSFSDPQVWRMLQDKPSAGVIESLSVHF